MPSVKPFGCVELSFTETGVFLHIGKSASLPDFAYVERWLAHRGVEGVDRGRLMVAVKALAERMQIAQAQEERPCDEGAFVELADEDMTAILRLLPAHGEGGRALSREDLSGIIREAGVTMGLQELAIAGALTQRNFGARTVIARGKPPVHGKDVQYIQKFKGVKSRAPAISDDGKADYYNLNLFEEVVAGQPLMVRVPATPGEEGYNVRGAVIAQRPGRDLPLPMGKNVSLAEDGNTMVADIAGRVDMVNGRVTVSSKYTTDGNVDMKVGNVIFSGDVVVRGSVISGMTISAQSSVEVFGIVEAAAISAGGSIVLRKGMQGSDKGTLSAGGDIVAGFIERANISLTGTLTADAIIHSNIVSEEGSVLVKGRKGALLGGTVRACDEVTARTIGSQAYGSMSIEVGLQPSIKKKIADLEASIAERMEDVKKLDFLIKTMARKAMDDPKSRDILKRTIASRTDATAQMTRDQEEINDLKLRIARANNGKVNVLERIYPGVTITIGGFTYTVREAIDYVTFKVRDGEIVYGPCEVAR